MKDWIPVFKTGMHTDSAGNTKTWIEQDLDNVVEKFDPKVGAPLVIGHPKENAPAYGWVEGLKRVGQYLYYKPMQVVPAFKEMVNKGMFKKRSISMYPDGTLRHIGYLGAVPPAIKGLPDHMFMVEEDSITIEFEEYRIPMIGRMFQRLRDFLIEKYDTETADKVVSDYEIDELKRMISEVDNLSPAYSGNRKEELPMNIWEEFKAFLKGKGVDVEGDPPTSLFSEANIQKRVDAAVKEKTDELTKEFSEKEDALKKKEDALKAQASEAQKKSILDFCEGLKTKGVLTPAMEKHGMGLQNFMEQISSIEAPVEFSEGDEKKKQTPLEFMQSFLKGLPKAIEFGEVAGTDKDTAPRGGNAGEKLESLTQQKLKDNKDLSYTQAFSAVQTENPELAQEYAVEIKGGQ